MIDPFIGEIALFAGNFAPQGWAFCDGTVLQIQQNPALYSILGTTYGGDGVMTFALPDLRGRVPVGIGQYKDDKGKITNYVLGQKGGSESTTLTIAQLPVHTHLMGASTQPADQAAPNGNVLATEPTGSSALYHAAPTDTTLAAAAIGMAGNGQAVDTRQPYLAINYIIALEGIYPQRP